MKNISNIAGYKFLKLSDLSDLRDYLKMICQQFSLKGTILLSQEGINIMLAGELPSTDQFLLVLKQDARFVDLEFKKTHSDFVPFKRLLVKIKKEIITFAVPAINPAEFTAPSIKPTEFKQWLDQGKDITVLDVRNVCELEAGKFTNAIDLQINNFSDFPKAVEKLPQDLKQKPLVMYCTGGIRCEKASAYMLQQGFQEVYQLQGGILQYFAEAGNAHYDGKCFVFDDRRAI
jgi:UPF0176 protein